MAFDDRPTTTYLANCRWMASALVGRSPGRRIGSVPTIHPSAGHGNGVRAGEAAVSGGNSDGPRQGQGRAIGYCRVSGGKAVTCERVPESGALVPLTEQAIKDGGSPGAAGRASAGSSATPGAPVGVPGVASRVGPRPGPFRIWGTNAGTPLICSMRPGSDRAEPAVAAPARGRPRRAPDDARTRKT